MEPGPAADGSVCRRDLRVDVSAGTTAEKMEDMEQWFHQTGRTGDAG